ncbi:MAG TPA: multicopper oxidase domain-containing protein [Candidatus Limnocylindrales bacterium]|nr:multicopper oxidase domain-containing protein [Candidatus Limnocylindrales bacterium]
MEPQPQDPLHPSTLVDAALSRRGFLRGAAVTGGGLLAATLAACAPSAAAPGWTYPPTTPLPSSSNPIDCPIPSGSVAPSAAPSMSGMPMPSASASASPATGSVPPGWTEHDVAARTNIRRYIGNLAPGLKDVYGDAAFAKLVDILGASEPYPEIEKKPSFVQVPQLNLADVVKPLKPEIDGGVKVFKLTVDEIQHQIDEVKAPVAALGYNGQWPGPTIKVTEGDKVRVVVTNNMKETTGVHFHGVLFDDFFQDGVPFVTQKPITPGETYTYEFTANNAGSLMYHSHHNATDQVGRGLLGAFIVEPKSDPVKADHDFIWISNDTLGGFTINGHGFPAVQPVLAATGETVRIRFMNEGIMMHPWHLHGYVMKVIERDGRPLGSAAFECDTLGVNPGERYDVLVKADRPGIWAFHCHILPHVEGMEGMFGMVNTFIVVPKKEHVDAIVESLLA